MSVPVQNFLRARRDRVVGTILGYAEDSIKAKVTPAEWEGLRQAVQSAANSYHDTVLDLVKVEDGTVRNDQVVELLDRVDRHLRASQASPIQTHVH